MLILFYIEKYLNFLFFTFSYQLTLLSVEILKNKSVIIIFYLPHQMPIINPPEANFHRKKKWLK